MEKVAQKVGPMTETHAYFFYEVTVRPQYLVLTLSDLSIWFSL